MVNSQGAPAPERTPMLIGAFAQTVATSRDTVRFYTRLGLLTAGSRSAGQRTYATYADAQIERFSFIEQCKALGFTLQEIGQALHERDAGSLTALRQQALLEEKLRSIEQRIASLREAEARLRAKLEANLG
ncbi:MAG: MerR family DNA-binding protein [Gaiellales bacterium]